MAYCMWVVLLHKDKKLPLKTTGLLLIASLIPFMTLWAEKKILKGLN
ncbi:MAG: DUF3817 domain-containing protein [Flavobacteriales bacterium]